jgi:hypothetical protein
MTSSVQLTREDILRIQVAVGRWSEEQMPELPHRDTPRLSSSGLRFIAEFVDVPRLA